MILPILYVLLAAFVDVEDQVGLLKESLNQVALFGTSTIASYSYYHT